MEDTVTFMPYSLGRVVMRVPEGTIQILDTTKHTQATIEQGEGSIDLNRGKTQP